jgi:hypothetical protein
MPVAFLLLLVAVVSSQNLASAALRAQAPGAPAAAGSSLDFEFFRTKVEPILQSKLLVHPLVTEGGGDYYHGGGKHWNSFLDPEWQTIANWVCGRKANEKIVELTGGCE